MALERIEFEGSDATYHSYLATQHIVRYAVLKNIVKNKRVLDVACGAGYGSKLLWDWGAKEVVGVDISPTAIASARKLFGGSGRVFLIGSAEDLKSVLASYGDFDVVVSFETIEHLRNPDKFFSYISSIKDENSIIALSCPNDAAYHSDSSENPYHLTRYTFDEFKIFSEDHLGAAAVWLLGAPVHGEVNFIAGDNHVQRGHADANAMVTLQSMENGLLLPSQSPSEVSEKTCSHYLGLWGTEVRPNVAVSAQSVSSFREPWSAIEWLKTRLEEKEKAEDFQRLEQNNSLEVRQLESEDTRINQDIEASAPRKKTLSREISDVIRNWRNKLLQYRVKSGTTNECDYLRLIAESGMFDAVWYKKQNEDLRDIDLLSHYLQYGGREGRSPSSNFDGAWYLAAYPDVAESDQNPLVHYLQFGASEGRLPVPQEELIYDEDQLLIKNSGLFDAIWYGKNNPDLLNVDLLTHYTRYGGVEGRSPGPNFDGSWYLRQYPDVAVSEHNPLVHYLRYGAKEGRLPRFPQRTLDIIEATIEGFSAIEPDIESDARLRVPEMLHLNMSIPTSRLSTTWNRIFCGLRRNYNRIIFVPWLVRGGADMVAANAARSVIETHGPNSVLLVLTDLDKKDALDWVSSGVDVLCFSDFDSDLTHEERVKLVEFLIFSLRPASVLNINSRAAWDVTQEKGKYFSSMTKLFACLFCHEFDADNRPIGYAQTHFRSCLPALTKIYIDNEAFIKELSEKYDLIESYSERLSFLPQPISPGIRSTSFLQSRDPSTKPAILWSGRFCRQKNIGLLIDIVRKAPHLHFDIYGGGDKSDEDRLRELASELSNLELKGHFSSIEALPTERYAAYIFTSLWEGMPTTLINLAAKGIPIVAADVGAVNELVTGETGWLIKEPNNTSGFLDALEFIWRNPAEAKRRTDRMLDHVQLRYSNRAYTTALQSEPSFLG